MNLRILTQAFVGMFLEEPHLSHRHEAKLLEEYAGDLEKRKIFRDDHSPYPYYVCALTWYMFEKYFREEMVDRKYKAYKAHIYLIFKYSVGEFMPRLSRSKGLDSYCDKIVALLKEDTFINHIKDVLQLFDKAEQLWSESKSRFGIKDNKEFTELLIKLSREKYVNKQAPTIESAVVASHEGNILRIVWKNGVWFGFIKRDVQYNNVYFDSRGYRGEIRDLLPSQKVKFELCSGERGDFARNVQIND